ncbi:MAG: hypothetical protein IPI28_03230 [Candidatus Omnitrophica bacterium]|nr:hypothetical protein [Candidatus Omnitrophota bacterium]
MRRSTSGKAAREDVAVLKKHGLMVGSVDLENWQNLFSKDEGERKAAVQENIEYIREANALGQHAFSCV